MHDSFLTLSASLILRSRHHGARCCILVVVRLRGRLPLFISTGPGNSGLVGPRYIASYVACKHSQRSKAKAACAGSLICLRTDKLAVLLGGGLGCLEQHSIKLLVCI